MVSYLLSITSVAILTIIITNILKEGLQKQIVLCISGTLLLFVVLKPLTSLSPTVYERWVSNIKTSQFSTEEYELLYMQKLRTQIQSTTEEYIRKRAEELGAVVTVRIELTDDTYPVPYKVEILGSMNTEQLSALKQYVTDSIGIEEKHQLWRNYG